LGAIRHQPACLNKITINVHIRETMLCCKRYDPTLLYDQSGTWIPQHRLGNVCRLVKRAIERIFERHNTIFPTRSPLSKSK
jgi:hypothetical protein